jgi:hypothetical protein
MPLLPIKSYGEQVGEVKNNGQEYETERKNMVDFLKGRLDGHEKIMGRLKSIAKRYDEEKDDPKKKLKCERDIYEVYANGKILREGFYEIAADAGEVFNGEVKEMIAKVKEKQAIEEKELQKLIKDANLVLIGWQETMYG